MSRARDHLRGALGVLFLALLCLHSVQGTAQTVTVHTTALRVAGLHGAMRSAAGEVASLRAGHAASDGTTAEPQDALGQPLLLAGGHPDILFQANMNVDWEDRDNHAALDEYLDALIAQGAGAGGIGDWLGERYNAAVEWKNDKVEDLSNYVGDKVDAVIASDELREAMEGMSSLGRRLTASSPTTPSVVDVVLAILFGLINGVTFGFGDVFRDGIRKMRDDPKCTELWNRVKTAFTEQIGVMVGAIHGVFDRRVRGSVSRVDWVGQHIRKSIDGFGEILASIWALCTECEGLADILKPLILMVVIGLVLTLILLAIPGIGWLIKLAAIIVTIIVGASFIYRTAKKFVLALKGCITEDVCTKQHKIDMVEAAAETVGFIFAVILLSTGGAVDDIKDAGAQFRRLGQKFKLEYQPAMKARFEKFSVTMKDLKAGRSGARTELATYKGTTTTTTATTTTTTAARTSTSTTTSTAAASRPATATSTLARSDGIYFNYKAGRWQGPNGQFVRAPAGMPRYDASVARWRGANGRFVRAPEAAARVVRPPTTTTTTASAATTTRAAATTTTTTAGAATRTVTVQPRNGMYWDGRPQVQRWREVASGRFAKSPPPRPVSPSGIYFDGRPQVMRWRDSASGRFVRGPQAPVTTTTTTAVAARTGTSATSTATTVATRTGKRQGIVWDGRPQVQRWRDLRTGQFAKGPRIVWDGRPQVLRWRDLRTGRFVKGPRPPTYPARSIEAGVHFDTATSRWVSHTNTVIRVQPSRPGMITFDPKSGKWISHRGRIASPPRFPIWKDGAWRGADGHVAPSWGPWPRWDPNVSRWRDALGRFSRAPTQPQVVLPFGWNEPAKSLGVGLWRAWELAFRLAQLDTPEADEEVEGNDIEDTTGPEEPEEPVVVDDVEEEPVVTPEITPEITPEVTAEPEWPDIDEPEVTPNPVEVIVTIPDRRRRGGQVTDTIVTDGPNNNGGQVTDTIVTDGPNNNNGGQVTDTIVTDGPNNNGGQVTDTIVTDGPASSSGQVTDAVVPEGPAEVAEVAVDTTEGLVIDPAVNRDPVTATAVDTDAAEPGPTATETDLVVRRAPEEETRGETRGDWVAPRDEVVRRRTEPDTEVPTEVHTAAPATEEEEEQQLERIEEEHIPEPEDGVVEEEETTAVASSGNNNGGQVITTRPNGGQVKGQYSTTGPIGVAPSNARLDRVEAEVASLKSDVGTIKREVEVLVRSNAASRRGSDNGDGNAVVDEREREDERLVEENKGNNGGEAKGKDQSGLQ
eukprot:TRINITY_DN390_c0_g2_i5.p1 TRINITY_DN390_c0_g2~~TRINITY_DN390_c0_g2_i5.p1  ORF type:complete len:1264 (-),score=641.42 TRINITY_DN390_c0_g2_i5:328-4119(-)